MFKKAVAAVKAAKPQSDDFSKGSALVQLRNRVIAFYENPAQFIDMSTLTHEGDGHFSVQGKSFKEILGLDFLGNGAYADVYALSETKVLKVIKHEDSGYARFVDLCKKYPNNPHLPKVFYAGRWGQKTVYILERLTMKMASDVADQEFVPVPTPPGVARRDTWGDRIDSHYQNESRRRRDFDRNRGNPGKKSREMKYQLRTLLRDGDRRFGPFVAYATPEIEELVKIFREHNLAQDLHSGNIMFRGETFVVTDPCIE